MSHERDQIYLTKFTESNCGSELFGNFIQIEKRYPTYLYK